jgi:hypothetical protein
MAGAEEARPFGPLAWPGQLRKHGRLQTNRGGNCEMPAKPKTKPASTSSRVKARRAVARLEDIPNVGPSIAGNLRRLGITSPDDLPGRDPYALYDDLCRITRVRHDPCLLDVFIAAVRYMSGESKRPWWKYTAERKRELASRAGGK